MTSAGLLLLLKLSRTYLLEENGKLLQKEQQEERGETNEVVKMETPKNIKERRRKKSDEVSRVCVCVLG